MEERRKSMEGSVNYTDSVTFEVVSAVVLP